MTIRALQRNCLGSRRAWLLGLTLALVACNNDTPATGDGSETASETAGDGDPTTGDGDPTTGDGDPTTGDGDPTCGAEGCPCSGDTCDPGLACVGGACKLTECGDGVVEGDEECDEGDANVDGGGCNSDCTITSVAFVATGQHHTCAQIDGGRLRCWGRGEFGQLGYGNTEIIGDDEYPSDVGDVMLPGPVVRLSLGGQHSCAVLQDGGLRCWGLNDRGQLGYGNTNNLGDDEPLAMLPSISVPPTAQVELGNHHTCARVRNGELRCWGYNEQGQLGYANTFNVEPVLEMTLPGGPVTIGDAASGLAVGFFHSCVTLVNGGARCWGRNDNGQLGYGHTNNIGDDELPNAVGLVSLIPQGLPPNTEVVAIALGGNHSCALLSGGALTCWGANASGQLGGGDIDTIGDDELPSTRPPIELGGPAAAVVTGANHTCALRTDGQVVCWGANNTGQLGYGHTDNIGDDELPDSAGTVELGGLATQLAAGANHTCAVLASRELICWGQNNYSQLGLGSSVTIGDNETPADAGPVPVL